MKAPSYSPPPIDPATVQAEQTAKQQTINALGEQDRGDMGSLMAAYGTLAMGIGNTGGLGGSLGGSAGAKAVMTGKA